MSKPFKEDPRPWHLRWTGRAPWVGRRGRWYRPIVLAALGVCALLFSARGIVVSKEVGASFPNYSALGDSYASGPFILNQLVDPVGCWRSQRDYPHLVAEALHLNLTDVSCVAATTADVESPESTVSGTNPPQISAVNSSTRVVTLTLGGDNLGFTNIIENCAALTPWGPTRVGVTCKSHYDNRGSDQLAAEINHIGTRLSTVLAQIRSAAPSAKLFVVGYPDILPSGGGCWPEMPFTRSDVSYLRSTEVALNRALANATSANHGTYVDTFAPSENHNACTPESVRWIEPIVPCTLAAPLHPNAKGEAAMAKIVEQAMRAAGLP